MVNEYLVTCLGFIMTKKLLIDVDCGVDDAQAIMMALAAPNVEVLGITCVHGNTTVENVCRNTLRVLKACHKLEVYCTIHNTLSTSVDDLTTKHTPFREAGLT